MTPGPTQQAVSLGRSHRVRILLLAALIVIATVAAYYPAITAGFIWDDDSYVTENPLLRDLNSLQKIWTPGNTKQYYPVVFTAFWIEYQLWGLHPFGYHLVNVLLHATNAILVWRLCATLRLPAAWLIAAIFALHPVHVESVAWITERKNVLSGLFYLSAALVYLRFDEGPGHSDRTLRRPHRSALYLTSLLFFTFALLSKTVTCSLPVALILMMLYHRRPLSLSRLIPLIPLFGLGLVLALHTAHLERVNVGAVGEDFEFTFAERLLIATRVLLFYPYKLLLPWPLMFIYPRWETDASEIMSYWSALGVIVAGVALIVAYIRGFRGPALAAMYYAATIFPALGFFNIYPMRFSFVADHFQYLASLGVFTLIISSAAYSVTHARWVVLLGILILPTLSVLTWKQAKTYQNAETVWLDTLSKNPDAWMPHNNLGNIIIRRDPIEAEHHYRDALRIKPDHHPARSGLAQALRLQKRNEEAFTEIQAVLAQVHEQFKDKPDPLPQFLAGDYYQLGAINEALGRLTEAETAYREAIRIDHRVAELHLALARLLVQQDRQDEAAEHFAHAIDLNPQDWSALRSLALIRQHQARYAQAQQHFEQALDAAPSFEDQIQIIPLLIRLLATCPDPAVRDLPRATTLAERLCAATNWSEPASLDILASLYADAGRFDDAIHISERALDFARQYEMTELEQLIREHLDSYTAHRQ